MAQRKDLKFVDHLLSSALGGAGNGKSKLRNLFDQKLLETRVSFNQAAVNMEIDNRQLEKILDGVITQFDTLSLLKISQFLDIPINTVTELFFSMMNNKHKAELGSSTKNSYILNTFDLPVLKKIKFIDGITDMAQIDTRITKFFNITSVEDYKDEIVTVAYSSGARKSISGFSKSFWLRTAQSLLKGIENPYDFDREKLLEYIPRIRWHSTDVQTGLFQVVRSLFKLGVTVVYVPPIKDAHVRGATIAYKSKPCIIITDYTDFYPTLFFVLLHELFHILFDWEEICVDNYHVSNEDNYYTQNEIEANTFARNFFATEEDLRVFELHEWDLEFINDLAAKNNVHPSFYYLFNAYLKSKEDPKIWGRIRKHIPPASEALQPLVSFDWSTRYSIKQINDIRKHKIYDL